MDLPPVSRTRALSVADTLRDMIFDGGIAPGAHLMEATLASELAVSRTPVRDAMARLAEEGLLVYHQNRGFSVRRFDSKDVFDSFTLRSTLESLGCRLVGERGLVKGTHERLLAQLDEQHQVLYGAEWTDAHALRWQDLNLSFHYGLLELADNRWLTEAVRRARQLPIIYDSKSRPHDHEKLVLLYRREHSQAALKEHSQIVDALARREVVRAEALMREHILTNRDVLMRALASMQPAPAQLESPA